MRNQGLRWLGLFFMLVWGLPILACGGSAEGAETPVAQSTLVPAGIAPTFTPTTAPTDTPTPTTASVTNSNANLRSGPGTEFAVVGGVTAGTLLEVVAKNVAGDWYELEDGSWIAGFLVDNPPDVEVAATIPSTPVPTSPPAFIQPTTVQPQAVCRCDGDAYNCSSFSRHSTAQACFNYCLSVGAGDIHRLDRDNDGSVCED